MTITLKNEVLDAIDMSYANPNPTFAMKSGVDHYRLMAYMSQQFNNSVLFDIGTQSGASALALAFNPSNHVHSFDIVKNIQPPRPNITYHIGNILQMPEMVEKMLTAPFISLDVDPHDAEFEKAFIGVLETNGYKGMVYMDDTFTNKFPKLHAYWETIKQKKINVAKVGHGSGIVMFNPEDEIIIV